MNHYNIVVPKHISILILLAVILNLGHIILFGNTTFIYLFWNIFLAFLPFVVSSILLGLSKTKILSLPLFIIGGLIWLILFPNAPYMITDLIHIGHGRDLILMYNVVLLFSSALCGLVIGMHSLSHMDKILHMRYSRHTSSIIMIFIMFFTGFGMYLGRFLRFNSWDIIANPLSFLKGVWNILTYPYLYTEAYILSIVFFIFLYISYNAWKSSNT